MNKDTFFTSLTDEELEFLMEIISPMAAGALYKRFGATKSRGKSAFDVKDAVLGEIGEIARTTGFETAMGYINTAADKQQKGDQGYAK